jgi:hypothetical protein
MLDRTLQLDDGVCGEWSRLRLLEMNEQRAFACKAESRAAARATVAVRKSRVTEEAILAAAWDWFVRRNEAVDVAFSEVVARCRGIDPMRIRVSFDHRFGRRSTTSSA